MFGQLSNGTQGGRSLDAGKIEAAYIGFHKTFHDRLQKVTGIHRVVATIVETTELVDRQVWLTNNPKMRRWIGDKVLNKLRAESHPITTAPHEASLEVPKHDILNDKLGLYGPRINSMADAYGWALDELAVAFLAAGVAGVALGTTYDGQNLIDTDHTALSVGGTAQSNKVTGAFSAGVYETAIRRFYEIVDENGIPVNVSGKRLKLIHGPALAVAVSTVLTQATLATGETNRNAGSADPIMTPWLTARTVVVNGISVSITGTEWFLTFDGSTAVIIHVKRTPEFLSVEEGFQVFTSGKYYYGIEAEFGAAYGLWQEIVGGPGA
jgi:phage major head subunit gpT-like protein